MVALSLSGFHGFASLLFSGIREAVSWLGYLAAAKDFSALCGGDSGSAYNGALSKCSTSARAHKGNEQSGKRS